MYWAGTLLHPSKLYKVILKATKDLFWAGEYIYIYAQTIILEMLMDLVITQFFYQGYNTIIIASQLTSNSLVSLGYV